MTAGPLQTIRAVQPDVVVVELCQYRVSMLKMDERTLLREAKEISLEKLQQAVRQVRRPAPREHPALVTWPLVRAAMPGTPWPWETGGPRLAAPRGGKDGWRRTLGLLSRSLGVGVVSVAGLPDRSGTPLRQGPSPPLQQAPR